jgi:hypothetical protein
MYLDFCNNNISKDSNILEVGFGYGILLDCLKIMNYKIEGIEPYSSFFESLDIFGL